MRIGLLVMVMAISMCVPLAARAALSSPFDTFHFEARITSKTVLGPGSGGDFINSVEIGDLFSGTVRLKPAPSPGDLNPDPNVGEYPDVATIDLLGPTWSIEPDPTDSRLVVRNGSADSWNATTTRGRICGTSQCTAPYSLDLIFESFDGSALTSDYFPSIADDTYEPFDVAAWDQGSGSIAYRDGVVTFAVIPEPGTALLVIGGLAAFASQRRRVRDADAH